MSFPQKPRTLVLCFDGTANEFDADNTNVVKLFAMLKKDDFNEQLCYYQAGVGTWYNPGIVSPLFEWGAKVLDEAVAWYLDAHVMDGYKFLMQNYRVGDKICLFGFSRGAYTARALAGVLYKIGLLPKDNESQMAFAYKLYKREDASGLELCAGFKQTYCQDVKIEFIGVWDTVASVGIVMGHTLPFTNANKSVKTFRHALSLDERRVKFQPNRYHRPSPNDTAARKDPEQASPIIGKSSTDVSSLGSKKGFFRRLSIKSTGKSFLPDLVESGEPDDVLEVWFAGCHSDVGGGSVPNNDPKSLASVSLRWMVREIMQSDCGIQWDHSALERMQIRDLAVDAGPELTQKEKDLDVGDSLEPLHDQLKEKKLWWLLEIIPLHYSWQDVTGIWHKSYGFHLGKGRKIEDVHPLFHSSVKNRINCLPGYKPKAKWSKGSEQYVD